MQEIIHGLIAAPFTAMNADGSVNLVAIERQAAHLIATGVRGYSAGDIPSAGPFGLPQDDDNDRRVLSFASLRRAPENPRCFSPIPTASPPAYRRKTRTNTRGRISRCAAAMTTAEPGGSCK